MNLNSLLHKIGILNEKHFPECKSEHSLLHMKSEIDEVIAEPTDIEEWADVLICFFSAFYKSGFTLRQLIAAAFLKVDKNMHRKWQKNADGTYSHIKSES